MNYSKLYNDLISFRKSNVLIKSDTQYVEKHHIIPRCIGGDDSEENLVDLTAREHFVAHKILAKIYPNIIDLKIAVLFMSRRGDNKLSSRQYSTCREEHARFMSMMLAGKHVTLETRMKMSKIMKGKFIKEHNPFYGRTHSDETKKVISEKMKSRIEENGPLRTGIKHTEEALEKIRMNILRGDNHPMRARPELARSHSENLKGVKKSETHKSKIAKSLSSTYLVTNPEGEQLEVNSSLSKFCKEMGLSLKMMETSYTRGGIACSENPMSLRTELGRNTIGWSCLMTHNGAKGRQ